MIVSVIPDVDRVLYTKEGVITSDAVILDNCSSWINLTPYLLKEEEKYTYWMVEITREQEKK